MSVTLIGVVAAVAIVGLFLLLAYGKGGGS